MAAVLDQHSDDPEQTRLEALERMLAALCDKTRRLAHEARSRKRPPTRETELQLVALDERRDQALACLRAGSSEPRQLRIGRLEKLVEALDCSWSYFSTRLDDDAAVNSAGDWSALPQ